MVYKKKFICKMNIRGKIIFKAKEKIIKRWQALLKIVLTRDVIITINRIELKGTSLKRVFQYI